MANLTESEPSTDLSTDRGEPQKTCLDRHHEGIDNGNYTTATEQSYLVAIIIITIACPLSILLNILVIRAVKKRPRLQNNANILLACLAANDVLSGLIFHLSFILWKAFQLNGIENNCTLRSIHNWLFSLVSLLSLLHLSLVTAERLIAIKYSLRYLLLATPNKIYFALIAVWVFCLLLRTITTNSPVSRYSSFLFGFVVMICILFILISYAILFRQIIRHQKVIKAQQLPQHEAERFVRENKAFKTTVFVVGALLASFLPMGLLLLFRPKAGYAGVYDVMLPWARTFAMLNSVFNPLIYCWRQKELRKFAFNIFQ